MPNPPGRLNSIEVGSNRKMLRKISLKSTRVANRRRRKKGSMSMYGLSMPTATVMLSRVIAPKVVNICLGVILWSIFSMFF